MWIPPNDALKVHVADLFGAGGEAEAKMLLADTDSDVKQSAAEVLVAALLFENRVHLARLGDVLFAPFETHPKAELVCIMVIGPGLMNAFQFWMQDSFLKRDHETDVAKSHISPRVGSGTSLGAHGQSAACGGRSVAAQWAARWGACAP